GQIVVQRTVPALSKLNFCRKGEKSDLATQRYREIVRNLAL
ncbi:MAG: prenyltransferase, partial [Clostridiales bacterium]|nr:prenyltransferase [Clostridiales bacterium]